jgi:hypothetical protein
MQRARELADYDAAVASSRDDADAGVHDAECFRDGALKWLRARSGSPDRLAATARAGCGAGLLRRDFLLNGPSRPGSTSPSQAAGLTACRVTRSYRPACIQWEAIRTLCYRLPLPTRPAVERVPGTPSRRAMSAVAAPLPRRSSTPRSQGVICRTVNPLLHALNRRRLRTRGAYRRNDGSVSRGSAAPHRCGPA